MDEMFANSLPEEHAFLTDLIVSDGWKVFRRIVKWRKLELAKRVIKLTREEKPEEARVKVASMDELDKILKLTMDRVNLTKPKEE